MPVIFPVNRVVVGSITGALVLDGHKKQLVWFQH